MLPNVDAILAFAEVAREKATPRSRRIEIASSCFARGIDLVSRDPLLGFGPTDFYWVQNRGSAKSIGKSIAVTTVECRIARFSRRSPLAFFRSDFEVMRSARRPHLVGIAGPFHERDT